jgi:hypothetical protein
MNKDKWYSEVMTLVHDAEMWHLDGLDMKGFLIESYYDGDNYVLPSEVIRLEKEAMDNGYR